MGTIRLVRTMLLVLGCIVPVTAVAQSTPVPTPTEEERKAAFPPDLQGHAVHDTGLHYFVLLDQLESQVSGDGVGAIWDAKAWVGGDLNRIWIRSEGDYLDGLDMEAHLLLGRNISRWWTLVGGVRQDMKPAPARTWAAIGIQGLAPQWFDIEATVYLGESARTAVRVEAEYDLLLTEQVILQPLLEVNVAGKGDAERSIGAGLSTVELGVRVRYEIKREVAPYAGLVWHRKLFGTGDQARAHGEGVGGWRLVTGLRLWF